MRIALVSLYVTLSLMLGTQAIAKKPDWPGGGGSAVIGFGLVELTPQKSGTGYVPTTFSFNYDIPKEQIKDLGAGQMLVISSAAAERYNDIPSSEFLGYTAAQKLLPNADFHMSLTVTINQPGTYLVGYGPWEGLITFDNPQNGRETYKISGRAPDGGALRWIDQDAGDFTIVNFDAMHNTQTKGAIARIRMVRDKSILAPASTAQPRSVGAPVGAPQTGNAGILRLNPAALERVNLIDAKW